jgi:hypothetical protein
MRRLAAAALGALCILGVIGGPADSEPRTQRPPAVRLVEAKLKPAQATLVLHYDLRCPVSPQPAFLAVKTSQVAQGVVNVARDYREVGCTGSRQSVRLAVPVSEVTVGAGVALLETELNRDNEPGSWRADESAVAVLTPGRAVRSKRVASTSIVGVQQTQPGPLEASVDVRRARVIARGAAVKVVYRAECPQNYFSYLFSQVQQDDPSRPADGRGTLAFTCSGTPQRLVTVVSLNGGRPYLPGSATITGVVNNCAEEFGCFTATDTRTVPLRRANGFWKG